jgi:hypothetical protein
MSSKHLPTSSKKKNVLKTPEGITGSRGPFAFNYVFHNGIVFIVDTSGIKSKIMTFKK